MAAGGGVLAGLAGYGETDVSLDANIVEPQSIPPLNVVVQRGCTIVAQAEYDVRYFFLDVESLVFNLKAVPIPEDFDIEKHWRQLDRAIEENRTPRGLQTNEHRELLIVRKTQ